MELFTDNLPTSGVGYRWLTDTYGLQAMPNWHDSMVASGSTRSTVVRGNHTTDAYPSAACPTPTLGGHLEFALRNDGTNLNILAALFAVVDPGELVAYVQSRPTGRYARRAWYLYEHLTGSRLPIDDLTQGNYVDLLDPADYVTAVPRSVQRQRVRDNLLGGAEFCPIVRRTARLQDFISSDLPARCRQIVASYPAETLRRALAYLYTKESKSSFEIEHIPPDAKRAERFVALLRLAEVEDFFVKSKLVDLQRRIVDERFRNADFRTDQNYVGETIMAGSERLHFISPRPQDVASLMSGMFASHRRMTDSTVEAVVHAAVVAYGFVFMHPFR